MIAKPREVKMLPHPGLGYSIGMELIFEVRDAEEGGYWARALGYGIFTQAETWEELRTNVLEATSLHFEDGPLDPNLVQVRLRSTAPTQDITRRIRP
jgi:predicted RNase H-like HicB family nuclease